MKVFQIKNILGMSRISIADLMWPNTLGHMIMHAIDFKNTKVIDKANNQTRKILESWHTAKTAQADNNSFNLPGQYKILLDKH